MSEMNETEYYQVIIRPDALQDAKSNYEYMAEYSSEKAVKWFNGLFEVINSLTTMPKRCSVAPETNWIGQELRCLIYRKCYRILYTIENDMVRIHHIRHTSQELMSTEEFSD
jgi:plasmid stabilization system protein ParE